MDANPLFHLFSFFAKPLSKASELISNSVAEVSDTFWSLFSQIADKL